MLNLLILDISAILSFNDFAALSMTWVYTLIAVVILLLASRADTAETEMVGLFSNTEAWLCLRLWSLMRFTPAEAIIQSKIWLTV